ncbi:MAG: hypothetical protein LC114_12990 [Bryobacterales bacterium]|nr:hypothetical protein [Bryobacterales bacterium]
MSKKSVQLRSERGYRNGVAKRQFTVRIKGSPDIGGYPRLSDFLKQLDAIKAALKHTERLHAHSENAVDYRIVSLSMASPATVVLEEIPKAKKLPRVAIAEKLISTLNQIENGRKIPAQARDLAALEAYRSVGTILKGDALSISSNGKEVAIDEKFSRNIEKIIGPDQVIEGSITGRLLAINLHNTTRFEIYPPAGPPKVACDFVRTIKPKVIEGLDRNVRVVGRLRYKHWAPFPHAITAEDLEVFLPNNELPTLMSLRGLALRESIQPDGR